VGEWIAYWIRRPAFITVNMGCSMKLKELLHKIVKSTGNDWHGISCGGAASGPSYKSQLQFYENYVGENKVLHENSHAEIAVYAPDISICMAFGFQHQEKFQEKWASSFPDPRASSFFVDVFYNNALVFRHRYVTVDGGRAYLPIPKTGDILEVPSKEYEFIRLLHAIVYGSDKEYDDYFQRANFRVVEEDWPG
jgi:hypothetical protein